MNWVVPHTDDQLLRPLPRHHRLHDEAFDVDRAQRFLQPLLYRLGARSRRFGTPNTEHHAPDVRLVRDGPRKHFHYTAADVRSIEELAEYVGRTLTEQGVREGATDLVRRGRAEIVAVTMGAEGALVASTDGVIRLPAIPVEVRSSVGAGDSFLSGMVFALSRSTSLGDATRYGIAAGAAALLRPGTKLCGTETIAGLYSGRVP